MHEPDTLGLEREERSGAAMALLFFYNSEALR